MAQPIPGTLGTIDLDEGRADVVASIEEAMRKAPKHAYDTRDSHRRRSREAGMGEEGSSASDEMLGSSNAYVGTKEKDLKRAAQLYVSLGEGKELSAVRLTVTKFVGEGRVYTGASVPCGEVTCKHVCDELMQCANLVGLTVPSVLSSLRQFVVEMRRGENDLARFFEQRAERSSTAGSASSDRHALSKHLFTLLEKNMIEFLLRALIRHSCRVSKTIRTPAGHAGLPKASGPRPTHGQRVLPSLRSQLPP